MIVPIESDKIQFHVLSYLNISGPNNNLCDLENTKVLASIFKLLLSFRPITLFCNNILHTGLLIIDVACTLAAVQSTSPM